MFERWRYRGRHRGYFEPRFRSVEAFTEAERLSAELLAQLVAEERAAIAAAHRHMIERVLAPLPDVEEIFVPSAAHFQRASVSAWREAVTDAWPQITRDVAAVHEQAARDALDAAPVGEFRIWMPFVHELDECDDDQAHRERLMGTAGA